jgi:hypothetical protein
VLALTPEPLSTTTRRYFDLPGIQVLQFGQPQAAFASLGTSVVPTTVLVKTPGRITFHRAGLLDASGTHALERDMSALDFNGSR